MLLMGKSTISMVMFNSYVKLPEGIALWYTQNPYTIPDFTKNWITLPEGKLIDSSLWKTHGLHLLHPQDQRVGVAIQGPC